MAAAEVAMRRFPSPPGSHVALLFVTLRPGVSQVLRLWHVNLPSRLRVIALDALPGAEATMRQELQLARVTMRGGRYTGHEAVIGLAPESPMAGVYLLVECTGSAAREVADRALWIQVMNDPDGAEWSESRNQARAGDVPESPLQAQSRIAQGLPAPLPPSRARTQWLH